MRISTSTMYESGATRLSELQSSLMRTQQQISANRRILTPADDPVASARALEVTQSQSINKQFATNRGYATNLLSQEENVLQSVTSLIQDVQAQVVEAGNGAFDDSQRKYIATDLRGRFEELLSLANSRDSEGNYMFSGFQTGTQPFSTTNTGVQYAGDQGQRQYQVDTSRQMSISDSGDTIFELAGGATTYTTSSVAGNTGTAVVSFVTINDSSALVAPPPNYVVEFSNGGNDYAVYDLTNDPGKTAALTSGSYSDPQSIDFNGLSITITGTPADGDMLSVSPGKESLFKTVDDLITLLETPVSTTADKRNLTYGLSMASGYLSSALDNVLTVRASVGSRLKELETLDSSGDDRDLQYSDTLSKLQDLDYVKAISDLSLQKTTLDAAQQSYLKITNLSLFNYM